MIKFFSHHIFFLIFSWKTNNYLMRKKQIIALLKRVLILLLLATVAYSCKKEILTSKEIAIHPNIEVNSKMLSYTTFLKNIDINKLGTLKSKLTANPNNKLLSIENSSTSQSIYTDSVQRFITADGTSYVFKMSLTSPRAISFQNLTIFVNKQGTTSAFITTYTPMQEWITARKQNQRTPFKGDISFQQISLTGEISSSLPTASSSTSGKKTMAGGNKAADFLACITYDVVEYGPIDCSSGQHNMSNAGQCSYQLNPDQGTPPRYGYYSRTQTDCETISTGGSGGGSGTGGDPPGSGGNSGGNTGGGTGNGGSGEGGNTGGGSGGGGGGTPGGTTTPNPPDPYDPCEGYSQTPGAPYNICDTPSNPYGPVFLEDAWHSTSNFPGKDEGFEYKWWDDEAWLDENFTLNGEIGSLTLNEKALIALYPITALRIRTNAGTAQAMTVSKMGMNGRNDKSDAFRHAFFQAINTRDVGSAKTLLFSNAHESETPTELLLEKEMDLFNNAVGIEVGYGTIPIINGDAGLATKVMEKLTTGKLIYLAPLDSYSRIIPNVTVKKATNL